MTQHDKTAFATRVIHAGQSPDPSTGALMPPIYANSTYLQDSPGVHKGFDYGRSHNPTRFALERCVADLEGGTQAFAFASGLASISTVLELLDAGSHIVSGNDLYGGTFRLFDKVRKRSAGHRFSFVDLTDLSNFEAALQDDTRMVWVETPSNPLLSLTDLAAVARLCRARGIICVADNTFASPWIQRPLELGFDIVLHSTTKYLNGHSDVIGGIAVVGQNPELAERLGFLQNSIGAIAGPFDAFLTLRGVKTLALRMERHCSNALELAKWLEQQPQVKRVYYPGLTSHPQHELAMRQHHHLRRLAADGQRLAEHLARAEAAVVARHDEALAQRVKALRRQRPVSASNALRQLVAAARYMAPVAAPLVPVSDSPRILLLASQNDGLVSCQCSQAIARAWGVPLRMHPSAGHDLPLDDAQWVIGQVRSWMEGSP